MSVEQLNSTSEQTVEQTVEQTGRVSRAKFPVAWGRNIAERRNALLVLLLADYGGKFVSEKGTAEKNAPIYGKMAEKYGLSQRAQRAMTRSGNLELFKRDILWDVTWLRQNGLLRNDTQRKALHLTRRGRNVAKALATA